MSSMVELHRPLSAGCFGGWAWLRTGDPGPEEPPSFLHIGPSSEPSLRPSLRPSLLVPPVDGRVMCGGLVVAEGEARPEDRCAGTAGPPSRHFKTLRPSLPSVLVPPINGRIVERAADGGLVVATVLADGLAGGQVPQPRGAVGGGGDQVGRIHGEHAVPAPALVACLGTTG